MSLNEVREKLHLLIDEIDDEYVLRGVYRSLVREKADAPAKTEEASPDAKNRPLRRRKTS
ncbi:MAG: hypothetical protein H7Z72_18610 [Bacteroidetes bacterium]|nr:hypothetical protein [Fibrella sp.]